MLRIVRRPLATGALAFSLTLLLAPALLAQTAQDLEFTGVVRDASGAMVPRATVIVRRASDAHERIGESGNDGRFHFGDLDAGPLAVTVVAPGFAGPTVRFGVRWNFQAQ